MFSTLILLVVNIRPVSIEIEFYYSCQQLTGAVLSFNFLVAQPRGSHLRSAL